MEEPSIVVLNAETILDHIDRILCDIQQGIALNTNQHSIRKLIMKVNAELKQFEDNPKLMDTRLERMILQILLIYLSMKELRYTLTPSFAEIFYQLTKIRGFKFVGNFCSSDIYLFPKLLKYIKEDNIQSSDFECFMLLIWLSRLAIVPFALLKIAPSLKSDLYDIALKLLVVHSHASRTQIGSLFLLSNLLTRLDCVSILNGYVASVTEDWPYKPSSEKVGHLLAINRIIKKFSSPHIALLISQIHSEIIDYDIIQLRHNAKHQISTIHALYLIKVMSKMARYYVQVNQYEKVADMVNCILIDIMDGMGASFDTKLRECTSKNMTKIVSHLLPNSSNYASQLTWFMVDQLDIPNLSAHPKFYQQLTVNSSNFRVDKYHTTLLFLGFSTLRRCLPLEFAPIIISIVNQTLFISENTFEYVKGSQVRDASCFCLWAFFKRLHVESYSAISYDNFDMIVNVFTDIIKVIIFDDDFTIRRCGIAVLQEFVGRFGDIFFLKLLLISDLDVVAEFSIKFIEKFSAGAVSSLHDSHLLIYDLHSLGFQPQIFLDLLLSQVVCDKRPFETRKLGATYLAGLLSKTSPKTIVPISKLKQLSAREVADYLLRALLQGNYECLYALAEFLLQDLLAPDVIELLLHNEGLYVFDHNRHSPERAESMLHWINSLLEKRYTHVDMYLSFVIPVSSARESRGLKSGIRKYFGILSNFEDYELQNTEFQQICGLISRGNNILADGITRYLFNNDQVNIILQLMTDFKIAPETRSLLISGADSMIAEGFYSQVIEAVLVNMDDYTVTEQGDVGLKLRIACISLLTDNLEFARQFPLELKGKLIRLAGESMDKLRGDSFQLICQLEGIMEYRENYLSYTSDYHLYFKDLFDFYEKYATDKENFWRGIVHSAGALTGSNSLINNSVREIFNSLYSSGETSTNEIIKSLFRFLKPYPKAKNTSEAARYQKTVDCTLNLLGKIFDAEVKLPKDTNYETLYIRVFNLHLTGVNLKRMRMILKIFQHMSCRLGISSDIQQKCRRRLCWLACRHKSEAVRNLAAKNLFEIVNDICPNHKIVERIDTTDWFGESDNTKLQLENTIAFL